MGPIDDEQRSADAAYDGFRLEPGANCWREVTADRAMLFIDAAPYFADLEENLRRARRRVMILGWDIDSRIRLGGVAGRSRPLAEFLDELARSVPGLEIYILMWDFAALYL